jgi:hypothetical protein
VAHDDSVAWLNNSAVRPTGRLPESGPCDVGPPFGLDLAGPLRLGKALFATVSAQAREREAEVFAGVAAEELQQMSATLGKLIASVAGSAG